MEAFDPHTDASVMALLRPFVRILPIGVCLALAACTTTSGTRAPSNVANVARLNAVTLGGIASAPPVPDSVTARRDQPSGGQKWMLAWKPVPGAVAYEVLVRSTTAPTHEKLIRVGNVTSYLLSDQLDDLWASVRSVGANGHRSIAVVVPPPTFVIR